METSTPIAHDKRLHIAAAKRFGVEFSDAELTLIGTLVGGYILQSQLGAVSKAKAAGAAAAAEVKTSADAAKALGGDL